MTSSKIWVKANPCVMMRENLKTKSCEYIPVYVNDLYVTTQKPEDIVNTLNVSSKLREMQNYLMIQVE